MGINCLLMIDTKTLFNFVLCPCQHDNGYVDKRSQILQVHADERTQIYSARSSLVVTNPSTNRGRRAFT